jgi:hypothetical protein
MKYTINYGFGTAVLYTPSEDWKERFYTLANQCFGIRKSITIDPELVKHEDAKPKIMLRNEYERLEHSGDVVVWNKKGKKILSEFE